ncbi:MAG: PPC domain-containing protein [Verrucomicrobiota bacterium]
MRGGCTVFLILFSVGLCTAQQSSDPNLSYAYPAGGKKGASLDITVGGQRLQGITDGQVSGQGVQVTVTGFIKPLPQKRFDEFRDAIAEKRKQMMDSMQADKSRKETPADIAATLQEAGATDEEIRLFRVMQSQRNDPKRQPNTQLAETLIIHLKIDPDAAKGPRTLRLFGKNGIANPLSIFVGDYPEVSKPGSTEPPPASPPFVQFPVILNGQILPGQTDRYVFHAVPGEHLVFVAQARDLIPYLADAVPGWFEPVMTIQDAKGNPLASAQSFRFAPDPVLFFDVKEGGEYTLQIRDALYRGREDFVYRITAGRIPFVTGIFPLGGLSGSNTSVEVSGWNLPRSRISIAVPPGEGIECVPQLANGLATMDVAFAHGEFAEPLDVEPNNDQAHAQPVTAPANINGRIDYPGDVDVFSIKCKKGSPVVVEVFARRLNSPLDSFLRITDADGKQLATNDDFDDKESGLLTHHADSRIDFIPPSSGVFYVHLSDAQRQGGPEYTYRLRIDRPRPDFALRVAPSGINGAPGATVPVAIYAVRKDGFSGEINLSASAKGFVLSGGRIPPGSDSITTTLTFPEDAKKGVPQVVEISGTADISGLQVSHKAVAADDRLQAFIYHQLVPAPELLAYPQPDRPPRKPLELATEIVRIPADGADTAKVVLPKSLDNARVRAVLKNPPEGIWIDKVLPGQDDVEIAFRADRTKAKPGSQGNLIVELTAGRAAAPSDKDQTEKRWSIGLAPAIPYMLLEK